MSARVGRLLGAVSGAAHSGRQRKEVMRKLKLQMQVTVDGYVAGPEGQLDWMTFDMDAGLLAFINHLTDTSDTILLGRKMTDGFIKYWEHVVIQKDSPEHAFAQKMVGLPKVVFSKTLQHIEGKNVRVENGDLVDEQLPAEVARFVGTADVNQDRPMSPSDQDEVCALYRQVMDGWNAGSVRAFAAPFAEECDFVAFDGERLRGREESTRFHEPLFETYLKGTRLVGEVTDVRFLGPHVAVLHASGGTVPRGRSRPAPERDSIQTLVAARRDGVWRLVTFQNTRVRPIGGSAFATLLWLSTD